jgi:hypothetical protein
MILRRKGTAVAGSDAAANAWPEHGVRKQSDSHRLGGSASTCSHPLLLICHDFTLRCPPHPFSFDFWPLISDFHLHYLLFLRYPPHVQCPFSSEIRTQMAQNRTRRPTRISTQNYGFAPFAPHIRLSLSRFALKRGQSGASRGEPGSLGGDTRTRNV